jgi:ankyrin repeat protein
VKRIIDEPLKESKASIDESDDVRRTPLMMAAKDGSPDVIETLVEAGAVVNAQSVRVLGSKWCVDAG